MVMKQLFHFLSKCCLVLGVIFLAGCSSPRFYNQPSEEYLVQLPSAISGVWGNQVENGERVRLAGLADGTLQIYFFNTNPSVNSAPEKPFLAQTLHFDNTDWVLIDFDKLAAWKGEEGKQSVEDSPFRLLKYSLETPDRLCGTELSSSLFYEAIKSGILSGKISATDHRLNPVKVTSTSSDWINWWTALPKSEKRFGPNWCFKRIK